MCLQTKIFYLNQLQIVRCQKACLPEAIEAHFLESSHHETINEMILEVNNAPEYESILDERNPSESINESMLTEATARTSF